MKKLKKIAICALVLMTALLLSGCMKMHINVVWKEDNSAVITMTYGIDKSVFESPMLSDMMGGMSEADVRDQIKESMESDDVDFTFKDLNDSKYIGVIATGELKDITKDNVDSMDSLNFRCQEDGKKKVYTVSGRFDGSELTEDLGDVSELEDLGIDMSFDVKFIIEMPGNITEHNATEKNGNTLTWVLDTSKTTSIQATSESGGAGSLLLWILLIVLIVILIVIIVAILMISKKSKASPQGGTPEYGAGSPYAPPYQAPGAYTPPAYTPPEPQQQYAPPAYAPPEPPQYAPPEPPQYAPPEPPQYAPPEPPQYAPPEPPQYAPPEPPQYAPPEPPQYAPPEPPQYAPPEPPQYAPPEPPQYAPPEPPQYAPPEPSQYAPPEPPQYAPPAYAPPEQSYAPPAGMAPKCAQCGAELPVGTKFCTVCGAPTGN